jgi:hypothetical protein
MKDSPRQNHHLVVPKKPPCHISNKIKIKTPCCVESTGIVIGGGGTRGRGDPGPGRMRLAEWPRSWNRPMPRSYERTTRQ